MASYFWDFSIRSDTEGHLRRYKFASLWVHREVTCSKFNIKPAGHFQAKSILICEFLFGRLLPTGQNVLRMARFLELVDGFSCLLKYLSYILLVHYDSD